MTNPMCGYKICEFIPEAAQSAINAASQLMQESLSYVSKELPGFMGKIWSNITNASSVLQETYYNFFKYETKHLKCTGTPAWFTNDITEHCVGKISTADYKGDFIGLMIASVKSVANSTKGMLHYTAEKSLDVLDKVTPQPVKNIAYRVNAAIPYEAKIAALFCIAAFGIRHIYKSYHKKPEVKNDRFTISDVLKSAPKKITELFFVAKKQISTVFGK